MSGFKAVQRDHQDVLPLAPCWKVERDYVLSLSASALTAELAVLAGDEKHYWVLQQGPLAPGSKRQSLLNLDSDLALAGALGQTFSREGGPDSLVFQCMPPQRAAGVLFTRHPMRPDLEHIVVEGCLSGSDAQQRIILHADGALAWRSPGSEAFTDEVSTAALYELAQTLHQCFGEPRAAEWIWDGAQLSMVQALPIGTLAMPSEVWTRRAGLGFSNQAISPLWYTMLGRWLKEGFWRKVGHKAGWSELSNVEPYRRQHSYLYGNGRFFRALQNWRGGSFLWWALPPAWRHKSAESAPLSNSSHMLARAWVSIKLLWLELRTKKLDQCDGDATADEVWLELIRLDRLGKMLSSTEGALGYIYAPAVAPRGTRPTISDSLLSSDTALLSDLGGVSRDEITWAEFCARHGQYSAGDDPVFPRLLEQGGDSKSLPLLLEKLSPQRAEALIALRSLRLQPHGWLGLRRRAAGLRQHLAGRMRRLLLLMSQRLVALRRIKHPDDIFFLYFDELWQAWQGQTRRQLDTLLGERKVRYLSDAHAGPPDWIIDSIGYGTSPLGQRTGHDTVQGYGLVSGKAQGRVQRIGSGWQLNQVEAGDVLVLDQSDIGWLPWIACASGLVLAHRDPLDPAAALACALGIPTVWGVDDAMHCLPDGVEIMLDGDSGHLDQL